MSCKDIDLETEHGIERAGKRRKGSLDGNTNTLEVVDHNKSIANCSIENSTLDNNSLLVHGVDLRVNSDSLQDHFEDLHKGKRPSASENNECSIGNYSPAVVDTSCNTNVAIKLISEAENEGQVDDPGVLYKTNTTTCTDDSSCILLEQMSCAITTTQGPQVEVSDHRRDINVISFPRRKLLVLDINGILVDVVSYIPSDHKADLIIGRKAVFKRPHCDNFLQFCFERFNVGIWSSRMKKNVDLILELLFGDNRSKLVFRWDQSHCTHTGFHTLENQKKPIILKELKKLWGKYEPDLPWETGDYYESNTLLLDDSPYKALKNPPNTSIFPDTYHYNNLEDDSLGPAGDLRLYLEELYLAANVQEYVEQNPYGQPCITESHPSWHFYAEVIGVKSVEQERYSRHSDVRHASSENTTGREWSKMTSKDQSFIEDVHSTESFEQKPHWDKSRTVKNEQQPKWEKQTVDWNLKLTACSIANRDPQPRWIPHYSYRKNSEVFRKTKLLILDVNGLLTDFVSCEPHGYKADSMLGDKAVFKRPYCDDFLNFCFEKFHIGFWLTTSRRNAEANLNFLLGRAAQKVLFSWDMSHCFKTDFVTLERNDRIIIFKELQKLWKEDKPWSRYTFDQSNTLLVDNNPYTALLNPPYTAIFPPRYRFMNERTDNSLGPGGDLREYLEQLVYDENVQEYVRSHPFGQEPITDQNLCWGYYARVLEATKARQEDCK